MLTPTQKRFTRDNFSNLTQIQHKLKGFNIKNIKKIDKNLKNKAQNAFGGLIGSHERGAKGLLGSIGEIESTDASTSGGGALRQFSREDFSAEEFCEDLFSKHHWQHVNQDFISELKEYKQGLDASLQKMVYENYEKFIATSKLIESFLEADIVKLSDVLSDLKKSFRTIYHLDFDDLLHGDGTSQPTLETSASSTDLRAPSFSRAATTTTSPERTTSHTNLLVHHPSHSLESSTEFQIVNNSEIYDEELDSVEAMLWRRILELDVALGMREFERSVQLVKEIEASMKQEESKNDEHHMASSLLRQNSFVMKSENDGINGKGMVGGLLHSSGLLQSNTPTASATSPPTSPNTVVLDSPTSPATTAPTLNKPLKKSLLIHKKELELRTQQLHEALIRELHNPLLLKENCHTYVRCLKQLTSPKIARHNFLKAKSYLIRERIRDISMQGDILLYVQKVATILFRCILRTGDEFKHIFQETRDVSAFTQWILQELSQFAQLFKNQVFSSASFSTIANCLSVVFKQCHSLEEAGISVTFRLEQLFKDDIIASVIDLHQKIDFDIRRALSHEHWNGSECVFHFVPPDMDEKDVSPVTLRLSPSCKYFFNLIINMCIDVAIIQTEAIYDVFIETLSRLIEDFLALMSQQSMNEQMNDKRFLTIISNVIGVKDHLLTWIIANFSSHFKRSLPKLTKLAESIERLDSKLCEKFCSSRAELIVEQEIQWNHPKYPGNNLAVRTAGDSNLSESVSRPFRQYFGFLFKLQNLIVSTLLGGERYVGYIVQTLHVKLVSRLRREGFFWKRLSFLVKQASATASDTDSQSSRGSQNEEMRQQQEQWKLDSDMANQVLLDIRFLGRASEVCGAATNESKEQIVKILQSLQTQFNKLPQVEMREEAWFEERVRATLQENVRLQKALEALNEAVKR
eukprot:CAMPEP_0117449630 /NCGR_PEP_ID=MMETSP0759-20121206/8043_1 /TAXON_ID=63605 /ORGANISM="Percolomonas cosmopolitus, Strain WS" /LENGTH=918 /DNA_ID=CAMNT_0005242109 /DNA_START=58 /DNA_END=2814 /DNA_ORIENTATION=+